MALQMRKAVIRWYFDEQIPVPEIAQRTGYSRSTIYNIINIYRDFREYSNPLAFITGRPPALTDAAVAFLVKEAQEKPTTYLDELQYRLDAEMNEWADCSTICRVLERANLTHKAVHAVPGQQNDDTRFCWLADFTETYPDPDMFVCIDESAVNERTARRTHGYAPINIPCVQRELLVRGTRFSVLPAMTLDGIIALDIFEGSVNRERLLEFLRNELVRLAHTHPLISSLY